MDVRIGDNELVKHRRALLRGGGNRAREPLLAYTEIYTEVIVKRKTSYTTVV
jgi:hypothetical protein